MENEWEGNIIFSLGTSNSRGAAILIPNEITTVVMTMNAGFHDTFSADHKSLD